MTLFASDFSRIEVNQPDTLTGGSKLTVIDTPLDIECIDVGDGLIFLISYLDRNGYVRRITCNPHNTRFLRKPDCL